MCGIAGYYTLSKPSPEQKVGIYSVMTRLFDETKSRGTDAAGFAYINAHGELVAVKGPVTSESIIKDKKWLKLETELPDSLVAHCRAWTKGSPLENFNNHPITVKRQMALIHNGSINNDDHLKDKYKLEAKGEVDSEVIPLMIEKNFEELIKEDKGSNLTFKMATSINMSAQELTGGYSCALLDVRTPRSLYLFNHTNPLVLAYCKELNTIFFASTEYIMKNAFLDKELKWGIFSLPKYEYSVQDIANDTIVVLAMKEEKVAEAETPAEGVAAPEVKEKFKLKLYDMSTYSYGRTSTYVDGKTVWSDAKVSRVLKLKPANSTVYSNTVIEEAW